MNYLTIYTDGGARGNPGPAGAGAAVFRNDKEVACVSQFLGEQTNNWAEYEALILGLDAAKPFLEGQNMEVEVRMDSELIVKQMNGEYRVKDSALKLQYARVKDILSDSFFNIEFKHVRRENNERADALANEAMDRGE